MVRDHLSQPLSAPERAKRIRRYLNHFVRHGKGVERVSFSDHRFRQASNRRHANPGPALVSSKFDLSGGMRGETL